MIECATLVALKATATSNAGVHLTDPSLNGIFTWTAGNFSATPLDQIDVNVVEANASSLSIGAWLRQSDKSVATNSGGYSHAVLRSLGDAVWDDITVKDFGASGDGAADDTLAVQSAINTVAFAAGTPTTVANAGIELSFPKGIYCVGDLSITNVASSNNGGLNGLTLTGQFAVLKGLPGANKILSVATASTSQNISGIRLDGLQFDLTGMTGTGAVGLYMANAYRCVNRQLAFYGGPAGNTHIQLSHTGSQTSFYDCHASRIRIEGDDYGPNQLVWTTLNFFGVSWVDLLVDKAWGLNFYGCVAQNPSVAAFKLSNCDNINILGGDFEGDGGVYLDCSGGNVTRILSQNNRTSSLSTYVLGQASSSQLIDRMPFSRSVSVATTATEIYNYVGDPQLSGSAYTYAILTVFGDNGSAGFVDQVAVSFGGVVTILHSATAYGAPPARNYSFSGASVRLTLASGSMNVRVIQQSSPLD